MRKKRNVNIPAKLVIILNPEIQVIINDESPIRGVKEAEPTTALGGEKTTFAALSSTKEPPRV